MDPASVAAQAGLRPYAAGTWNWPGPRSEILSGHRRNAQAPGGDDFMIELDAVTKEFRSPDGQNLRVLDGLSLRIESGRAVSVIGPSGSGKSTMLSLVAGLDRPTTGRVHVAGHELAGLDEESLARFRAENLGFVFQSFNLVDSFTAQQNVQIAAEIAGLNDASSRAREALERVGLGARREHRPHAMSGGEQQRVAIARAIVTGPKLLLCDEPTGSLDRDNASEVLNLLRSLQSELQTTMLIVTHDGELARQFDGLVELRHGRLLDADSGAAAHG